MAASIPPFDPITYDIKYMGRVTVTEYEGVAVVKEAHKRYIYIYIYI